MKNKSGHTTGLVMSYFLAERCEDDALGEDDLGDAE